MKTFGFMQWYRRHHPYDTITKITRDIIEISILDTGYDRQGLLHYGTIVSPPGKPEQATTQALFAEGRCINDENFKGVNKIWVYCNITLDEARHYDPTKQARHHNPGVRGPGISFPATYSSAVKWLAAKGVSATNKRHMAHLDPVTVGMKGELTNYYYMELPHSLVDEGTNFSRVPHLIEDGVVKVLVKSYGYVKKNDRLDTLLKKALFFKSKEACIDYASVFLEKRVYDIDLDKIDWSRPITIVNAAILIKPISEGEGEEVKVVSKSEKVVSKSEKVVSKSEKVVSKSEKVVSKGEKVVSKGEKVVSKGEEVVETDGGDMDVSLPESFDF